MVESNGDGNGAVLATFRLPVANGAQRVCVVGEFNDWSTTANPMEPTGDGFVAVIPLEAGRSYRFRYLIDDERWENDWSAHAYVPNEFGGDDSVIDLTDGPAADGPPMAVAGPPDAEKPKRARKRAPKEETS